MGAASGRLSLPDAALIGAWPTNLVSSAYAPGVMRIKNPRASADAAEHANQVR